MLQRSGRADGDVQCSLGAVAKAHLLSRHWHFDFLTIHTTLRALSEVSSLATRLLLLYVHACALSAEYTFNHASTGTTRGSLRCPRASLLAEPQHLIICYRLLSFDIALHIGLLITIFRDLLQYLLKLRRIVRRGLLLGQRGHGRHRLGGVDY